MAKLLIHDSITFDFDTGKVIEDISHNYDGNIAECKGGSSTTTYVESSSGSTPDYAYNSRLASVYEQSQNLANQYFNFWQTYNAPLEAAKAQAELSNVAQQDRITKGLLNTQEQALSTTNALTQNYLNESLNGVNANEWAEKAGVDQQLAASKANQTMARDASRLGLNMNSGAFANAMAKQATTNAANEATARTNAYRQAEEESYNRLKEGSTAGLNLLNQSGG